MSMYKKIGREIGEGVFKLLLVVLFAFIAIVVGHAFVGWLFAGADPVRFAAAVSERRGPLEFGCGFLVTYLSGWLGLRGCGWVGGEVGEVVGNFIEMERKP